MKCQPDFQGKNANTMKKTLTILFLITFSYISSYAQSIKLTDALSILGKDTIGIRAWAKSKEYQSVPSRVSDFMSFIRVTSIGTQELQIAVKGKKINGISWTEHLMYASYIRGDAQLLDGFTMKPQYSSRVLSFENVQKAILLNLFTQEETNQVKIIIGKK
jgi:hypothetical protein